LIITDIHSDVVDVAQENILSNCPSLNEGMIEKFQSDLCKELISRNISVDLLYENLPNLPVLEGTNIKQSTFTASFYDPNNYPKLPTEIANYFLSLHYLFLKQAKLCLTPSGFVVCCIGVRVPMTIIQKMFIELGFYPDILVFDMVLQLQADDVLDAYVSAEESGHIEFNFYPYDKGIELLQRIQSEDRDVDYNTIIEMMKRLRLSAREAKESMCRGWRIGHLGAVIKGSQLRAH